MSNPYNNNNGYTNGNGAYTRGTASRREDIQDGGSINEGREHRAGGYGGFHESLSAPADSEPQPQQQQQQPQYRRRGQDEESNGTIGRQRPDRRGGEIDNHDRSGERNAPDQNSSRLYSSGPGWQQIDGVLEHINEKWDVLTKDDCVPVHIALQLMDHSSLGRGNDYHDFQRTSKQLQKALKAIVNEHHQGFNSSIGTFHKIQSSIHASQTRVRTLRNSVHAAKSNLMTTKPELKGLGSSSQIYDDMLQLVGQIEKLQLVPEQLDARISDKHFLPAVEMLQDALRVIRKSDLESIGALADLRTYFTNQETSLTDILVEELHDHLYLKSPYCQDRCKPYTPESINTIASENRSSILPNTWGRPLYRFLDSLNTSAPIGDDASQNPEADSFQYIYMIIESLNKLGHLDIVVDRMEQRLPIELFAIVDRTNHEVNVRHPTHLRGDQKKERRTLDFNLDGDPGRTEVMDDLLWTLYSKFEAIAEGHRVVHDVVAGIVKREGLRHPRALIGGFKEMWKLYQSEMRSLLHDYLATDDSQSYRRDGPPIADMNIFHRHPRDKTKRVFKFSDIDKKSPELLKEQEELNQILQASVPGLVSKSQRRSGVSHNSSSVALDAPVAGHKLLIEPSVFNISLLLPPSLSFLQRLKDVVPPDSEIAMSTLTSFLDDFLVNVFHPQLEETVTELCTQSFIESDAFQQDPQWSQHAARPIFKGTSTFFALIRAFCKLLDSIPQDQTFTQLIISQMIAYYDKCCEWYRTLVTRVGAQSQNGVCLKAAAAMAEGEEFRGLLDNLWPGDLSEQDALLQKEVDLLILKTNEIPLEPFDIISDRRSVAALCMLYASMQWIATRLSQLRHITTHQPQPSHRTSSGKPHQPRRWTLLNSTKLSETTTNDPVHLPMTPETAVPFDNLIASFRSLATQALQTLHLDIRCGIIHMLSRTISAPYLLSQPANDPDPAVLALNADLLAFDDNLSTYLPKEPENTFITTGLALLLDTLLVRSASRIQNMNAHGCARMQLNILVLQQNLKSIETHSHLSRSARFFDLFTEGADAVVARAKKEAGTEGEGLEFNLEELKVLVELCFSEGLGSEKREVAVQAKRGLSERLLVLSECLWNT